MTIQELNMEIFTPCLENKEYPENEISMETSTKYIAECLEDIKHEMSEKYPEIPCKTFMTTQPSTGWITVTIIVVIDGEPFYFWQSYTINNVDVNTIHVEKI